MPLSTGEKLGPYEVVAAIGAGGMGEVYKARDTRLDRTVAIKVLPDHIAQREDLRARFEREARAVASLSHPNICTLHDIGPGYMVMEMIEGETLAARIERGALALDHALRTAAQIADALDRAHRAGVTHRDIKPQNIMLTRDGVKILDFGLAKSQAKAGLAEATLTKALTTEGAVLGTPQYMAPEQFEGREADERSDIWAFGAVLYEMVTGEKAFQGKTYSSLLGAILSAEPRPMSVQPFTPSWLERLVRRCLAKDPDDRWQSMRDIVLELRAPPEQAATAAAKTGRGPWIAAAAFALVALACAAVAYRSTQSAPAPLRETRFTIPLPPGHEITSYPAIGLDGRTIAYASQQGTQEPQLYLRDLSLFETRLVAGSSGAKQPFFSPDGKWVAFFAQGYLQKAEVAGGAPIRLAEAAYPQGGTWNEDNTIVYTTSLGSGLLRIPASGGAPEQLTRPDGAANGYAHIFPMALPGGRNLLFVTWGQKQGSAVLSLDTRQWQVVLPSTGFRFGIFDPVAGSRGRLLVVDQSAGLMAAPFDAEHPAPTSAGSTVLSNVYSELETEARGWFASSLNRTAVYTPANPAKTSLAWVDRAGKAEAISPDQDAYREALLSPDGAKAVVRKELSLWLHDLVRGSRVPLTTGNSSNLLPLWSNDGARVLFASNRAGTWDIYSQPVDGSRAAESILKGPFEQIPYSILPDGTLLYLEINLATGRDLWILSPGGKRSPFRVTPFNEGEARFSPGLVSGASKTGWIAYTSDESGRREVYVEPYPEGNRRIVVSSGGGSQPRWSHDGKELFYVTGDSVVASLFRPDGSFDPPRRLFDRAPFLLNDYRFQSYQPSPDGKRFLMIRRDEGSIPRQLNVILNWSGGAAQ